MFGKIVDRRKSHRSGDHRPVRNFSWRTHTVTSPAASFLDTQASGLTLALTRLTYDTRFTTTAEAIVVRDSDGIRILSAGRIGLGDGGDDGKSSAGNGTSKGSGDDATTAEGATGNKKSSVPARLSASRLKRHQARRSQVRDATSAREKIEAAAATLAENQKRETSALFINFVACDKRYGNRTHMTIDTCYEIVLCAIITTVRSLSHLPYCCCGWMHFFGIFKSVRSDLRVAVVFKCCAVSPIDAAAVLATKDGRRLNQPHAAPGC